MDQIYGMALDIVQVAAEVQPVSKRPGAEGASETNQFKELLQQKKAETDNVQKNDQPNDSKTSSTETDSEPVQDFELAQELAASQMMIGFMPNQVIVPEETETMVENLAPVAVETIDLVSNFDNGEDAAVVQYQPVDELEVVHTEQVAVAEEPVELVQADTDVQTPKEDVDQPVLVQEKPEVEVSSSKESDTEVSDADLSDAAGTVLFKDVESIPIKVAETEDFQSDFELDSVETQISDKLVDAVRSGESKVEIRLEPEFLGSVKVEISQGSDGLVHVVLSAESIHTQNLLQKHISGLQSFLMTHGQETAQVEVQRQQEDQQADNRQNFYDGRNGNHGQQQRQENRRHARQDEDFLHQLRLGLIPMDEVS